VKTLSEHSKGVYSVSFSPDGTLLASGSLDKTVTLWNVRSGECVKTLSGHSKGVRSVSFSPDGTLIASGACMG
jgi:WD40 repeat protein